MDPISGTEAPGLLALARLAASSETPEDLALLRAAVRRCLTDPGVRSIDDALGIGLGTGRQQAMRDWQLCQAVQLVEGPAPWTAARQLHAEWERVVSRGVWARYRHAPRLPVNVPPLERLLFMASTHSAGVVLSPRQILRITERAFLTRRPLEMSTLYLEDAEQAGSPAQLDDDDGRA